jgi:hypothetical protein
VVPGHGRGLHCNCMKPPASSHAWPESSTVESLTCTIKKKKCAGLSKILLILGRLRRLLPGPKLDSVENPLSSLF